MEDSELKLVLETFLKAQQIANETLLRAMGYQEAKQAQEPMSGVIIPNDQEEELKRPITFYPDIEFDPEMEDSSLWPQPDLYRLTDIPRKIDTVGEIK